jgi:WD40 repeat protein
MPTQPPVLLFAFANEREDNARYLRALSDERRAIASALSSAERSGLCELKILPNATLDEIFAAFQDSKYRDRIALFHYGGHASHSALLLEDSDRKNQLAQSSGLIPFLMRQQGLQVVFLNGCTTEKWAMALNEAGVPLVIGTFEVIPDEDAQKLAAQFYSGLGQGVAVRRAWEEAVARVRAGSSGQLRDINLGLGGTDRFPWGIFQRKGADVASEWNLPDACGKPLARIPLPVEYDRLPLPNAPFRYLHAYRKADAPIFFGRDRDIRSLYDRLNSQAGSPVILLSGQSGVGKSSFLNAGIIPRLEHRCQVLSLQRVSGKSMVEVLSDALGHLPNTGSTFSALAESWLQTEQAVGKPLVCIIDQVERVFTDAFGDAFQELGQFCELLNALFDPSSAKRPKGRLVLSFRKDYEAEIEDVFKQHCVGYEYVFLKRLTRQGVVEIINGIKATPRLAQKYGVAVEDGLAEAIASDLLSDSDTPVAPVLQIVMTKLWETKGEDRRFTLAHYQQLKAEGLFIEDFLRQQLDALRTWEQETGNSAESSGLALDVLDFHSTDKGYAKSRNAEELKRAFQHHEHMLDALLSKLKTLYLLSDVRADWTTLTHDALALAVSREANKSNRPGQSAKRILSSKLANHPEAAEAAYIDEADLAVVEAGQSGMRIWSKEEAALVKRSQTRRQMLRRRRLWYRLGLLLFGVAAIVFGYNSYQNAQIERWVTQARLEAGIDPTKALQSLEKAVKAAPENLSVIAAWNDIWSNNEFYEQALHHPAAVLGLALSASAEGPIYSWTETTVYAWSHDGLLKDTFVTEAIAHLELSPDDKRLAVATQYGTIAWLDAERLRQERITRLPEGESAIRLVFNSKGDTLYAASSGNRIYALQVAQGHVLNSFSVEENVSSLLLHPSRNTLLIGYENGEAEEVGTAGGKVKALSKHKDKVLSFAVNKEGDIASAGRDAELHFKDSSGQDIVQVRGHDRRVNSIAWSVDGALLFSVSDDGLIKSWSPDGELIGVYRGHKGIVSAIAVFEDGRRFASASSDGTVKTWKINSKIRQQYGPHLGGVSGMVLGKDGNTVFIASDAGMSNLGESLNDQDFDFDELFGWLEPKPRNVSIWDAINGERKVEWEGHSGGINNLAYVRMSNILISASDDKTAILWDEQGRPETVLLDEHSGAVLGVAATSDAKHIVTVGEDSLAVLWDRAGQMVRVMRHDALVRAVACSPNDQFFAVANYDGSVLLYSFSGEEPAVIKAPDGVRAESLCFSPDGQSILIGAWNNKAHLYSMDGQVLAEFELWSANKTGGMAIRSVAISPDGARLALGAEGGLVEVFRLVGGRPISALQLQHYPKQAILSVSFTPDGSGLLVGSNDGIGRWWVIE